MIDFLNKFAIVLEKLPTYPEFYNDFSEYVDKQLLMLLSTNEEISSTDKEYLSNILKDLKYDKKSKKHISNVRYHKSTGLNFGRSYSDNKSLIPMSKKIKHTVFSYCDYIDLDMKSCHMSILASVAKLNGIKLSSLELYLTSKEYILSDLIEYYGTDRSHIKELINTIMYGGSFNNWSKDKILSKNDVHKYITSLMNDIKCITSHIIENNKPMYDQIEKVQSNTYENNNRLLSYYCQTIENDLLYRAYMYLISPRQKFILKKKCSLEFDGLCFPQLASNKLDVHNVNKLNTYIRSSTGLHFIEFGIKPYTEIMNNIIHDRQCRDIIESGDNYEEVKDDFELNNFKIQSLSTFIVKFSGNSFKQFSKTDLKTIYENKYYIEINDDKVEVPRPFIDKWLKDPNILTYESIGVYPDKSKCPSNVFNIWSDFEMHNYKLGLVNDIEFLRNHIKILCNNDDVIFNYIEMWISYMIKYPHEKSICPIIIGAEGNGKSAFVTMLGKLIGINRLFITATPERDVWGNFNGLMANCYLVNLNELSRASVRDSIDKIKQLITDSSLTINNKGKDSYTISSCHKFIVTTNNEDGAINTTNGDRRFLVIRSSDEMKGNSDYFVELFNNINNSDTIKCLFDYYYSLDKKPIDHNLFNNNNYNSIIIKIKTIFIYTHMLDTIIIIKRNKFDGFTFYIIK